MITNLLFANSNYRTGTRVKDLTNGGKWLNLIQQYNKIIQCVKGEGFFLEMAKILSEGIYRLRMATFGGVCFLHFFALIALNGTSIATWLEEVCWGTRLYNRWHQAERRRHFERGGWSSSWRLQNPGQLDNFFCLEDFMCVDFLLLKKYKYKILVILSEEL